MWKRPLSVPIGQVWLRFEAKDKNGAPGQKYQVRDVEEKQDQQCLDLMMETFMRDEPLCQALDIKSDQESVTQILSNWQGFLHQRVSLAVFTETDNQPDHLVGFNFLYVKSKGDQEEVYGQKGENWRKLLLTLSTAESLVDVFSWFDTDTVLCGSGMTVLPEFRGRGIGDKLLQAREPLCKVLRIKASATVFTATPSQKLAARCGYELMGQLDYVSMMARGVDLTACDCTMAQLRGKRMF